MCHRNDTIKRVAPPAKITAAANRRDRRAGGRDRGFEKGGSGAVERRGYRGFHRQLTASPGTV